MGNPLSTARSQPNFIGIPAGYLTPDYEFSLSKERPFDVGYVGTWGGGKNWDLFFEQAGLLLEKRENARGIAVVLPANSKEQKEVRRTFRLRVPKGVRNRFELIDSIPQWPKKGMPNEAISEIFSRLKILWFLSKSEGCSKVVIEALKQGCVVLCLKTIKHRSGGVFPPIQHEMADPVQLEIPQSWDIADTILETFTSRQAQIRGEMNRRRFHRVFWLDRLEEQLSEVIGESVKLNDSDALHLEIPCHIESPIQEIRDIQRGRSTSDLITSREWQVAERYLLGKR